MATAHRSARAALDEALKSAVTRPEDAATIQLARNYARLLDNAAPHGRYAKAVEWLQELRVDEKCEQFRLIILVALSEHSVASDLGPKLLVTLTELGMTPVARAKQSTRGVGPSDPPEKTPYQLALEKRDELAQRRAGKAQ